MSVVFSRFPRLVRDLAGKLGKEAELSTVGEGTELDKGLMERLTDPLTHLVRNSLDHGLEPPGERVAAGKDPRGRITLSAFHQGGNVIIEVADDGRGLDRERILAKAAERGLMASEAMSDEEVFALLFRPGFSTASEVTDLSGRGVGMDVVKRNIQAMGGSVEMASQSGHGTVVTIRLPLTLAILDGLSVAVGEQTYILPLGFIKESLQPRPEDIRTVAGSGRLVHVRGEYLPLVALHRVFHLGAQPPAPEDGILVLAEAEGKRVAMLVDRLVGQHQVVIKSLESNFRKVEGISGATIMGDGQVALILDVGALVRMGARVERMAQVA
jgi:two-component system chemotaxis sensor kinase CheA